MITRSKVLLNVVSIAAICLSGAASAQVPPVIEVLATLHAEGAQIYECKPDSADKSPGQTRALTWQFREPIASLMVEGRSVGRHYAGPNWDYVDGSGVKGKVIGSTPAETSDDIPWLDIEVVDRRNHGILSVATNVERINTRGGVAQGSCESEGRYLSVPYSADYVFLRRSD